LKSGRPFPGRHGDKADGMADSDKGPRPGADPRVFARQTDLVFANSLKNLASTYLASIGVVYVAWNEAPGTCVFCWFAIMTAIHAFRLALGVAYGRRKGSMAPQAWIRLFTIGAALTGIAWGASAALFLFVLPPLRQFLLFIILGGMVAAATANLAFVYRCYAVYLACAAAIVIGTLLTNAAPVYRVMSFFVALYVGMMFSVAWWINKAMAGAIENELRATALAEELRASEVKLIAAKEAAENANTSKSEFLAVVSHELRTPLNGVLGMLRMIGLENRDPEQAVRVGMASSSGENLLRTINDLIDLSKAEAGVLDIAMEAANPRAIMESVWALFHAPAGEKGLKLVCEIGPDVPERILCDPARVRQILFNLTGNALKYTDRGEVRARWDAFPAGNPDGGAPDGNGLPMIIAVSDTGRGMSERFLKNAVDPFVQERREGGSPLQGAGLGLYIVNKLAGILGWGLAIESAEGVGTTVRLEFRAQIPPGDGDVQKPAVAPAARGLRVLVVEDEEINAIVVGQFLGVLQSRHARASTGPAAIETLSREQFDCVLMDVDLPGMSGLETARRIRDGEAGEAARNLPIIAMTAFALNCDREALTASGMTACLYKPLSLDELSRALGERLPRTSAI